MQGLEIGHRFLGTAHVGLAHDFDERHGGAVEVEIAVVAFVDVFARVGFHVDAGNADALGLAADVDVQMPEFAQRALELRNLVVVRHVGVEVVLTGEH